MLFKNQISRWTETFVPIIPISVKSRVPIKLPCAANSEPPFQVFNLDTENGSIKALSPLSVAVSDFAPEDTLSVGSPLFMTIPFGVVVI
jgi:hypothetical protein